jgi:putative glycosyltransferase (TIGR04372 family)
MRRLFALLVYRVPHYPFALGAILLSFLKLAFCLRRIRKAGVIVFMDEGGFGHTVTGPEVARRLYAGKRPVMILVSDRSYHNPVIASLYSDVDLIFLRWIWRVRCLGRTWHLGGTNLRCRQMLGSLIVRILHTCTDAEIVPLQTAYREIEKLRPVVPEDHPLQSMRWIPAWWQIVKEKNLPVHLPPAKRELVRLRINTFVNRDVKQLCCLYLRQKDTGGRIGSPLEAYVPAVRLLIESGYVVMITGDRDPDARYISEFDKQMVCARYLNVDPWIFDLYAATEPNIWIGDTGGGIWLSIVNRVPMLAVNGFPFAFAVPGASMLYKFVFDQTGSLVHYSTLFHDFASNLAMKGMSIRENTAEEILSAVQTFLEELRNSKPGVQGQEIMETFPDYAIGKFVGARLSESYLRAFG